MRSLRESILSSNGVSVSNIIRKVFNEKITREGSETLNRYWSKLGLDDFNGEWSNPRGSVYYTYQKEGKTLIDVFSHSLSGKPPYIVFDSRYGRKNRKNAVEFLGLKQKDSDDVNRYVLG